MPNPTYKVRVVEHYFAGTYNAPSAWFLGQEDYPDQPATVYASRELAQAAADRYNRMIASRRYYLDNGEYEPPHAEVCLATSRDRARAGA